MKPLEYIGSLLEVGGHDLLKLETALQRLGISAGDSSHALPDIEAWYDTKLPGVRRLLRCILREFLSIFDENDRRLRVYSNVPAPNGAFLSLNSSGKIRVYTPEFCIMLVLNGILGIKVADLRFGAGCSHCGMLEDRRKYICGSIIKKPDLLWSFGLLCDEACKTNELIAEEFSIRSISSFCPKTAGGYDRYESAIRERLNEICAMASFRGMLDDSRCDEWLELSILIGSITCENNRAKAPPLKPATISLIHSAALMLIDDIDELTDALREIKRDMHSLLGRRAKHRLYCCYLPPMLPEFSEAFTRNDIELLGDSAFIFCPVVGGHARDIAGRAAWSWRSALLSHPTRELAEKTADYINRYGCDGYLTGMFYFDRWLGSGQRLIADTVEEKTGKPVLFYEMDFWGRDFSLTKVEGFAEIVAELLNELDGL